MSVDSIGNFLTIIRNGIAASKKNVEAPFSSQLQGIAHVLKEEGYIKEFVREEKDNKAVLKISLKYVGGESPIHEIKRVSTPGRRRYENLRNMNAVIGGLGVSILSTSRGIMTDKQAKQMAVGGEVICHVW